MIFPPFAFSLNFLRKMKYMYMLLHVAVQLLLHVACTALKIVHNRVIDEQFIKTKGQQHSNMTHAYIERYMMTYTLDPNR